MIAAVESTATLLSVPLVFPLFGVMMAMMVWARTKRVGPALAILATFLIVGMVTNPKFLTSVSGVGEELVREIDTAPSDSGSESPKAGGSDSSPSEEKSPKPEKTTSDSPAEKSSPPPWEWILFGAAAVAAAGLAAFLAWIASRAAKRAAKQRREAQQAKARREETRAQHQDQWEGLLAKEKELGARWLSYEDDLELSLRYPVMRDVTDPKVAPVVEAMGRAKAYRRPTPPDPDVNPVETDYGKAVAQLKTALRHAEAHAQRVRWNNFAPGEKKQAQRALDMLKIAMDTANYPAERKRAYERVARIMEELTIPVSPSALLAIEESVGRLELTAA